MQKTQRILKYLPLIIGYFSLSVPAALGVYWLTSNVLSTVITLGIRTYFKNNPESSNFDIDLGEFKYHYDYQYYHSTITNTTTTTTTTTTR